MVDNTHKENLAIFLNSNLKTPTFAKATMEEQNSKPQLKAQIYDKYLPSKRLPVKIQDGCQRFCTYCIVPYLRGKPESKSIKYLVSSIKYQENYINEIILTAINTEAYGLDTGEKLTDLLETIIRKTKIPRISLGSVNPWSVNSEFMDFYKKILPEKRLVNFFHIPLQSGSNKILKLMERDYTKEEFLDKLDSLIKINPLVFLGTDIIVGFPGETDSDFEETYNFLKDSPISKFHIFRFSKREHTAAYFMSKKMKEPSETEKKKRSGALYSLGKEKYQRFLDKHVGKKFPAMFLKKKVESHQEALLDNQIPVLIPCSKIPAGEIKNVIVEKSPEGKLFGKVIK